MKLPYTQCSKCKKTQCRVCKGIDKKYQEIVMARRGEKAEK